MVKKTVKRKKKIKLRNVNYKVNKTKTKLKIEVDLREDLGPSKSGKSILVASSGGPHPIPDTGIDFVLVVYSKNIKEESCAK